MISYLIKPNLFAPAIFIMICLVSDNTFAGSAVFACSERRSISSERSQVNRDTREFFTVTYDAVSKTKANTASNILPRRGQALHQPCAQTVEDVTAAGCKYFDFEVADRPFPNLQGNARSMPLLIFVATGCGTAK